jgi:hypothetical protein
VFTVSVAVTAVVPLIVTGPTPHVGRSVAPVGELEIAQLIFTTPVNPPAGVTEIVDVFPVVAPGFTVIPLLLASAIDGAAGAFTVTAICVLPVIVALVESVPVTVTVYAPDVVVEVVLMLTVLVAAIAEVTLTAAPGMQVGGPVGLARFVVTAQLRFTVPT